MVASPEAGKGGEEIYLWGLQKGLILLTSLCQMSQGTVRTLFSGTSSGALWYEHLGRYYDSPGSTSLCGGEPCLGYFISPLLL